jgi:bacillithiol system protein YtxJ
MDERNEAQRRVKTAGLRELYSARDLETALRASHKHPVLLFKHSRACPVSHEALDQLLWHLQFRNAPLSSYLITVQTHPETCEAVTRILGVRHETPQESLVAAGRAVWHCAHYKTTAEVLAAAAKIDEGSGMKGEDRRPPRREEEPDDDDDEAPETPLDEPAPTPVQDPPDEPDKGPYTVHHESNEPSSGRTVCEAR